MIVCLLTHICATRPQWVKTAYCSCVNEYLYVNNTVSKSLSILYTHCGPAMPYGNIDLGQHWLRKWHIAWQHPAITWVKVDLSKVFCGIHLRAILQEVLMNLIHNKCSECTFKITATSTRGQWVMEKTAIIYKKFLIHKNVYKMSAISLLPWRVIIGSVIHHMWPTMPCSRPSYNHRGPSIDKTISTWYPCHFLVGGTGPKSEFRWSWWLSHQSLNFMSAAPPLAGRCHQNIYIGNPEKFNSVSS